MHKVYQNGDERYCSVCRRAWPRGEKPPGECVPDYPAKRKAPPRVAAETTFMMRVRLSLDLKADKLASIMAVDELLIEDACKNDLWIPDDTALERLMLYIVGQTGKLMATRNELQKRLERSRLEQVARRERTKGL